MTPEQEKLLQQDERGIPLTQGKVAIVDAADYDWLSKWKWCAHKNGNNYYAIRWSSVQARSVGMHRVILGIEGISRPLVDHIDHNGLNNCRRNLRLCNHMENNRNMSGLSKNNRIGFIGVCFLKSTRKWGARIKIAGKEKWVGSFATQEEAARARDAAALKEYGRLTYLNFPEESSL